MCALIILGVGVQRAPAQAVQFFLNDQPIALKQRALVEGEHVFVPLVEFARLLGAAATVSYESVTLRWGTRQAFTLSTRELVARGPLLYISLAHLTQILGVQTLKLGNAYYLLSTPARLRSVSASSSGIFFALSVCVPFELHTQNTLVTIRFFHTVSELEASPIKITAEPPLQLKAYLEISAPQTAQATVIEAEPCIVWVRATAPPSEPRALIRLESQTQVNEDIVYSEVRALTADGPVRIHSLKVQNWKDKYRLIVTLPRDGIGSLEPLEKMASSALVAINANFFDPSTQLPIGLLVKDGIVQSAPYGRRGALAISLFNDLYFLAPTLKLSASVLGQTVTIDGVNRPPTANGLFLYTDRYALPIRSEAPLKAIRLRHGFVVSMIENGLVLPDGESTLLVAAGEARRRLGGLRLGDRVLISYTLEPAPLFLREAVSAGPLLLKDGQIVLDPKAEKFSEEFVNSKAARSVIALTESGDLLFIIVLKDGRSVGADLRTLAVLVQALGAHTALALDGGSSSTLLFRQGATLQSIGGQRPIAAGLALVPRR